MGHAQETVVPLAEFIQKRAAEGLADEGERRGRAALGVAGEGCLRIGVGAQIEPLAGDGVGGIKTHPRDAVGAGMQPHEHGLLRTQHLVDRPAQPHGIDRGRDRVVHREQKHARFRVLALLQPDFGLDGGQWKQLGRGERVRSCEVRHWHGVVGLSRSRAT